MKVSSAYTRELEVRLLSDMVRLSRVTLLVAAPGSEKSALIESDLMPLLNDTKASGKAEIAILFDAWNGAPLPEVCARIQQVAGARAAAGPDPVATAGALGASLKAWQDKLGVTFLIIFDRFEEYLRVRASRVDITQFEEEFVRVVNDASVRANFLLSVDEEAEPLLMSRLRERIPRLGYSRVRLPRLMPTRSAKTRDTASSAPPPAAALSMRIAPVPAPATPVVTTAPSNAEASAKTPTVDASAGKQPAQDVNLATSIQRAIAARASALESPVQEVKNPTPVKKTATPQVTIDNSVQEPKRSPVKKGAAVPAPAAESPATESKKAASIRKPATAPAPLTESTAAGNRKTSIKPGTITTTPIERPAPEVDKLAAPEKTVVAAQAPTLDRAQEVQKTPVLQKPAVASPALEAPKEPEPIAAPLPMREPVTRRRGLDWFSWGAAALFVAGLAIFFQPQLQTLSTRVAQSVSTWSATVFTRTEADAETAGRASEGAPQQALDSTTTRQDAPIPVAEAVTAAAPTTTAPSPAPSRASSAPIPASPPQVTAAATAADPAQPRLNATIEKSAPVARSKPVPSASTLKNTEVALPQPSSAQPATRGGPPTREASTPAVKVAAPSASPSATAQASQRASQPQVVVNVAPAPAPAVAAPVAAPTRPSLYIHVRSEAQRAWAEQMIRPLSERGIRVAGIRIVPTGPDEADVRYYHLSQRDEAVKVAVALRDFGLRAQQLRHIEDAETAATSRQYELWLPATGYEQRP